MKKTIEQYLESLHTEDLVNTVGKIASELAYRAETQSISEVHSVFTNELIRFCDEWDAAGADVKRIIK